MLFSERKVYCINICKEKLHTLAKNFFRNIKPDIDNIKGKIMNQLPMTYPSIYSSQQPYSCNAVKIDIHNPQANMPMPMQYAQPVIQRPGVKQIYNYPQGSVYAQNGMPYPLPYNSPAKVQPVPPAKQQIVKPVVVDDTKSKIQPTQQQMATIVPPPPKMMEGPKQVINNNVAAPVAAPKDTMKSVEEKAVPTAVKAADKPQADKPKVNIKDSEEVIAKLRGNFVERLQSPDADTQSQAMIEIATTVQQLADAKKELALKGKQNPQAPELKSMKQEYGQAYDAVAGVVLDEKVVESILSALTKDSSSLEGPTPKQIELRTREIKGKTLTDTEKAEANKLSPMEKVEQNKEFALFTLRLIQEMYMEGIEKMTGKQPDLKDVPGVEQMVVTVKSNPNPAIRAAAISALTHNSREQDKEVLNTILKIASEQDADEGVRKAAAASLDRVNAQVSPDHQA